MERARANQAPPFPGLPHFKEAGPFRGTWSGSSRATEEEVNATLGPDGNGMIPTKLVERKRNAALRMGRPALRSRSSRRPMLTSPSTRRLLREA